METLTETEPFDAATCLLVSQFILDLNERAGFFAAIADRLRPEGILVAADLASGTGAGDFETLLWLWMTTTNRGEPTAEQVERARAAYARDVAILSPAAVATIIEAGGFTPPVQIFQAGLLHAWCTQRIPEPRQPRQPRRPSPIALFSWALPRISGRRLPAPTPTVDWSPGSANQALK